MTANEILAKIKEECNEHQMCNVDCPFYKSTESNHCTICSITDKFPFEFEIENTENY